MILQINIKHIKRDHCSDAWVMPQGWDLGAAGCTWGGGQNLVLEHGHVAYQIDGVDD